MRNHPRAWPDHLPPKEEVVDFLLDYGRRYGTEMLRAKVGEATRAVLLHETADLVLVAAYDVARTKDAERRQGARTRP